MSDDVKCSQEGCEETIKGHAWGRIKADGWFFQKDGQTWCPDHHPEWVAEWRSRKDTETQWDVKKDSRGNVVRARTKESKARRRAAVEALAQDITGDTPPDQIRRTR